MHYAAFPIKKCQLEIWAKLSPQPPFSWAPIISNEIFECQSLCSFTFKIYLGPSSYFLPTFLCINYFRQNSNALCECLEDRLNVALKSRLPNIFDYLEAWSTSTCESARYSTLHTRSFSRLALEASKCFGEICGKLAVTLFSWRISSLPDFQPWQGCQAAHIPKPTELQWCEGWLWSL